MSVAETVLLTDYDAEASTLGLSYTSNKHNFMRRDAPANRHVNHDMGGANYLFVDGHVKWLRPETMEYAPRVSDTDDCMWSIE
jgi:prepilin-type processing-associated H-X9-DG protein